MKSHHRVWGLLVVACLFTGVSGKARAQVKVFSGLGHDTGFTRWLGGVTLTGQIEGGIMANPARPQPGYNFGDFFADHANQYS